ncbi:MAG TPA: hypothetical protein VLI04_11930 [Nocardioidaceae bacterium]|nr:hypothetical protein [Nocardioidaceae bacterium]
MEALLAFYFGWTMGSRTGPEGMEELNQAVASLKDSEEFEALVMALRKHAASIIVDVAKVVEKGLGDDKVVPDVVAVIHQLVFPQGRPDPKA